MRDSLEIIVNSLIELGDLTKARTKIYWNVTPFLGDFGVRVGIF